jgi:hypothetical protein
MARQRVIVGIGEALLCEYPDRVEPGGLAVRIAAAAVRAGHVGIVISRVGQDAAAETLMKQMRDLGLKTDALQSDPDLATGRLVVRSIAGKTSKTLTARAAFDNLQWDFDLADVAQQADAVVFGSLARREGQSQSIIKRFLAECLSAMRVFDMTNRAEGAINRSESQTGLEIAEGLIADAPAMKALAPAWDGRNNREGALEIIRNSDLSFVIGIETNPNGGTLMSAHTREQSWAAQSRYDRAHHDGAVVGLLDALLAGADFEPALAKATGTAAQLDAHSK